MARTIDEIYNQLLDRKDQDSALDGLNSTSKVAIWRLLFYVVAYGIYIAESLQDLALEQLRKRAAAVPSGTARWYVERALAFQYGDALTWNGQAFVYAVEDESKQIVKQSAVTSDGATISLKAVKDEGNGLEKLATAEKSALQAYMDDIKILGTQVNIISEDPDQLKAELSIYYDPLIIAPDGSLVKDSGSFPVNKALADYLGALDFGGKFKTGEMVKRIMAVDGVKNVGVKSIAAKYGQLSYQHIEDVYLAFAGYLELNQDDSSLLFIAE